MSPSRLSMTASTTPTRLSGSIDPLVFCSSSSCSAIRCLTAATAMSRLLAPHLREYRDRAQKLPRTAASFDFKVAALKDRKSVGKGMSVYVRFDLGGRRINKNKKKKH